ncbi:MAG TPA: transcriptional regulator, partial [Verrucomicrobiales bacterium]|nr:transcriptional regulator [Verrucomicrobiales bacterium]
EIPRDVVSEAIVNAVVHRDYTSHGSVQVMLFADRLEIWNPGSLPATLTLEKIRGPHCSIPANPLLAEPMYLSRYIEKMGTGIRDMIQRCVESKLREPEFQISDGFVVKIFRPTVPHGNKTGQVTGQVAGQVKLRAGHVGRQVAGQVDPWVVRVLQACKTEPQRSVELQIVAGIKHRESFQRGYLDYLLKQGWLARTIPEKPQSRLQKYQLTAKGENCLKKHQKS